MGSSVIFEPIGERIGNTLTAAFRSDAKMDNNRRIESSLKSEREIADHPIVFICRDDQTLLSDAVVECAAWEQAQCAPVRSPDCDDVIQASIVTDIDAVPRDLLEQAQADIRRHIADVESAPPNAP